MRKRRPFRECMSCTYASIASSVALQTYRALAATLRYLSFENFPYTYGRSGWTGLISYSSLLSALRTSGNVGSNIHIPSVMLIPYMDRFVTSRREFFQISESRAWAMGRYVTPDVVSYDLIITDRMDMEHSYDNLIQSPVIRGTSNWIAWIYLESVSFEFLSPVTREPHIGL